MEDLTFGGQVKVVLSRNGMTIKELAEIIEDRVDLRLSVSVEYFRRRIC